MSTEAEERTEWTQADFLAEAARRFGDDPKKWAFTCPRCGDVATPQDFKDAGADPNRIGQQCIGRQLGALSGSKPTKDGGQSLASRGCDWTAYGLFHGPWTVVTPEGKQMYSFRFAEATS
jgi:hypothetical protein